MKTILILGTLLIAIGSVAGSGVLPIHTSSGILQGIDVGNEVSAYLGVPYASPPVGDLRFQPPQPLTPTPDDVVDAKEHAPSCIQFKHSVQMIDPLFNVDPKRQMSENCLFLNIFRPNGVTSAPILVLIPGEGFDFADASQFDGSKLAAATKSIVVTVQYRVGVFGFLTLNQLSTGNQGLWDQIESLKWIKSNAASLGGDIDRITAMGRMTGSMSLSIIATSPFLSNMTDSLLDQMILMSGVANLDWTIESTSRSTIRARYLLKGLGCSDSQCLMQRSPQEILVASGYGWRPVVDGILIAADPSKSEVSDSVRSIMMGSTANDGSICMQTLWATKSPLYKTLMQNKMTGDHIKTLQQFVSSIYFDGHLKESMPYTSDPTRNSFIDFCSEVLFTRYNRRFQDMLFHQDKPVYPYTFKVSSPKSMAPKFISSGSNGDDLVFALGLIPSTEDPNLQTLSSRFMEQIGNFINTGNPNIESAPKWMIDVSYSIDEGDYLTTNQTFATSGTDTCLQKGINQFFMSHELPHLQMVQSLSM